MNLINQHQFSRRGLLRAGSMAAVAGTFGMGAIGLGGSSALAKAPMRNDQVPSFYRFKIGTAEATIISDGVLPLGDPHVAFLGPTAAEIDRMLTANFLPTQSAPLEQNTLVLNTGERIIIFDNGMGISKLFGDSTGKLLVTLKQAGIDPKDVDALVMTHAHIDHCGGIAAADGSLNFPNAQLYITESDYNYWTDEQKVGPKLKTFYDQTRHNLVPNKDRITWVKDGQEILPGVHAILAPGHTVGHTMYMINIGNDQLCYIGDLTHHPVLLMERPLTEFAFDTDAAQSAQTRVKMLNMLAANKTMILAYHFAWPGIGHVAKAGDGFRYFPAATTQLQVAPL